MKIITTFILLGVFTHHAVAQEVPLFPAKLDHNGVTVQFYPYIIYLAVLDSKVDSITLLKVISESKMTSSEPTDTVIYTTNGKNQWIRKRNGDPFTIVELTTLQTKFGNKTMVSPTYHTPGTDNRDIFAPLPYVLVIDKKFVTEEVVQYLKNLKVTVNEKRTQSQVALTIFDVPRGNRTIFEIKNRVIEKFPILANHIRFENQPLHSELMLSRSESRAITGQNPMDQWNLTIIGSTSDQFTYTPSVKVGLIDMGCDIAHPALNIVEGTTIGNPSESGRGINDLHGTEMAGIIGVQNSSTMVIRGITPNIQIVPVSRTTETDVEVADAISYCITHHVDVINMSFGRSGSGRVTGGSSWDFANIDGALSQAHDHNIVLVAAAGNGYGSSIHYPARHPDVIAIGASDMTDKLVDVSNYGDMEYMGKTIGISVVAPGAMMPVTVPGGSIVQTITGTSGATAHVTALAALLKSKKPSLSADSIRYIIEHTADKIDNASAYIGMAGFVNGTRNPQYGYGRINIEQALAYIHPVIVLRNTTQGSGDKIITPPPPPSNPKSEIPWYWIIAIAIVLIIIVFLVIRKKQDKK